MTTFLLDTTTLTHANYQHPRVAANMAAHVNDVIGISSVNIEEVLGGWFNALRKAKTPQVEARVAGLLTESVSFLAGFVLYPMSEPAILRTQQLVRMKLNVGRNDLKIAALALELRATVVTNNARDFGRVPGLSWVDWTA